MLRTLCTIIKNNRTLICSIVFLVLYSVSISSAAPLYTTNSTTLDPQCIPGDTDCTVSQLPSQWTTGSGAISYDGNVGIGTSSLVLKFVVQNTTNAAAARIISANTSVDAFQIQSSSSAGYSSIGFMDDSSVVAGSIGYGNLLTGGAFAGKTYVSSLSRDLVFSANGGASAQVTLTSAGNMGIGIAPTTRFHIGNLPATNNYISMLIEGESGRGHALVLTRSAGSTQGLIIGSQTSASNTIYTGASYVRSAGGVDQNLELQSGQSTASTPVRGDVYTQAVGGNFIIGSAASNSLFSVNLSQVGSYGNVSTTSGSGTVTGTGTTFLTTFKVGDTIKIGSETRTVSAIASNASMTTDTWSTTNTNQLFTVNALTGTVVTNIGSPTVTGTGTNFTKLFVPGSRIYIGQYAETYTVLSVQSDTSLTLTQNSANTTSGSYLLSGNALIRFTVNGNGNVGIGNGLSAYLLTVGSSAVPTGTTVTRFQNAGGACDVVPSTSGGITCSSDYTLKKNITTLSNTPWVYQTTTTDPATLSTLQKVLLLQPVQYNWNVESDTDTKHAGFIAQDVQQLFPELVTTDPATNLLSLNYTGLLPYTIQALQDINIKVAAIPELTDKTLYTTIATFLDGIANRGEAVVSSVKSQFITSDEVTTKKLCLEDICVTKDQLQYLLQNLPAVPQVIQQPAVVPEVSVTPVEEAVVEPSAPIVEAVPTATEEVAAPVAPQE